MAVRWFLTDKTDVLTVFSEIISRNTHPINKNIAHERIIKSFDETDGGRLAASRGADEGYVLTWPDFKVQSSQNGHVRSKVSTTLPEALGDCYLAG